MTNLKKCPWCNSDKFDKISKVFSKKEFINYIGSPLFESHIITSSEKIYYCHNVNRVITHDTYDAYDECEGIYSFYADIIRNDGNLIEVSKNYDKTNCAIRKITFENSVVDYNDYVNINPNYINEIVSKLNGHISLSTIETLVNFT